MFTRLEIWPILPPFFQLYHPQLSLLCLFFQESGWCQSQGEVGLQQHVLGAPQKPRLHQYGTYSEPVVAHGLPRPSYRHRRQEGRYLCTIRCEEKHVNDKTSVCMDCRAGGWPDAQQPCWGSVALPHGHPSMETSCRITFIVLVEAGLSGQQSYHSYVDLPSAPLTSEYVLALKRHPNKSHDLALFSWSHLISDSRSRPFDYLRYLACLESSFHWHKAVFTISSIIVEKKRYFYKISWTQNLVK